MEAAGTAFLQLPCSLAAAILACHAQSTLLVEEANIRAPHSHLQLPFPIRSVAILAVFSLAYACNACHGLVKVATRIPQSAWLLDAHGSTQLQVQAQRRCV
eukprot:1157877-Pelagomonas_calceolata.AAC.5